jgi:hypothetical protein
LEKAWAISAERLEGMEIEDASGSQPPGVELEWRWLVGGGGRWDGRWIRRTLAGDLDDVAYLYGLLVVEGFFCPLAQAGIG